MNACPFFGIGIFVPVTDLKRAAQWYISVLGFEPTFQDEPNAVVMKMNDNQIVFCLVRSVEHDTRPFPPNQYQVEQYYNFHTFDIEGTYRQLKEQGANVTEIIDFDGMRGCTLYDPDGNRYGIVQ